MAAVEDSQMKRHNSQTLSCTLWNTKTVILLELCLIWIILWICQQRFLLYVFIIF